MGSVEVNDLNCSSCSEMGSPTSWELVGASCSVAALVSEVGTAATGSVPAVCSDAEGKISAGEFVAAVSTGNSGVEGEGDAGGGGSGASVGDSTGIAVVGGTTCGVAVVVLAWLTPALAQSSAPQGVTGTGGSKIPSFPPQYLPHDSHAPLYIYQIERITIRNKPTLRLHSSIVTYIG